MKRAVKTLLLFAALPIVAAADPNMYRIVKIGILDGDTKSIALGLSENGYVAGESGEFTFGNAFVWHNGVITSLGRPNALDTGSIAWGVNDSGVVCGNYIRSGVFGFRPFRYENGAFTLLGLNPTVTSGEALVINNAGTIGGICKFATRWDAGGTAPTNLFGFNNVTSSVAYTMDSQGHLIGIDGEGSGTNQPDKRPWLYFSPTDYRAYTIPAETTRSLIFGVNDADDAVGYVQSGPSDTITQPTVLHANGTYEILAPDTTNGVPIDINNTGWMLWATPFDIFNPYDTAGGPSLYEVATGVRTPLHSLLQPSDSGWTSLTAVHLNDAGQLVGSGIDPTTGLHTAVLFDPIHATISLHVTLGDFHGDATQFPIAVSLRPVGSTTPVQTFTVNLDASGNANLTLTSPGMYDIAVKAPHWLRKTTTTTVAAGTSTNLSVTLTNGDIDGNNTVNAVDLSRLNAALRSHPGDANYNANADLNGDGQITAIDLSILNAHLRTNGDN